MMPFVSLEWQEEKQVFAAAMHTLPSPASHANKADQWWSLGLAGHAAFTELSLLSGPCSINGKRGYVKANQSKFFPYTDTHLTLPAGAVIEKTFYLQVYPVKRQGSGFRVLVQETLDLYRPFSTEGLPTVKDILEAKYRFTLSRWHEGARSAGFRMYPHNNEYVMDVTLTYTVVWDIDMPAGRLRDHGLKTRGWTIVSAQNQHLDVFGVLYTPEIYRMGQYLKRDDLKRLAIVMYRSCGQMLDAQGSQGEQLNHTNFVQGMNHIQDVHKMRGTYREDWTVYWMTAHFLNAAAQFEEMGVSLD